MRLWLVALLALFFAVAGVGIRLAAWWGLFARPEASYNVLFYNDLHE